MSKARQVAIWASIGIAILQAVVAIAGGWEQLHPEPAPGLQPKLAQ